ncbi:MAG: hypothetical protein MI746_09265 [Pseudomonadales bacterium]|nr:hypothetical protein [Pseudomonadales bacterium]
MEREMLSAALDELLPDVRDGLNKRERIVLYCLHQAQKEFGDRNVPTITLYGRVVEHIDISQEEFQHILNKMVGMTRNSDGSQSGI